MTNLDAGQGQGAAEVGLTVVTVVTNLDVGQGQGAAEVGLTVVAGGEAVLSAVQLTLQSLVAVLQQMTHQPLVGIQAHCNVTPRIIPQYTLTVTVSTVNTATVTSHRPSYHSTH